MASRHLISISEETYCLLQRRCLPAYIQAGAKEGKSRKTSMDALVRKLGEFYLES